MGLLSMNAQQLTEKADDLSENGILKLAGRFLMLMSAPAMIWLGTTLWAMNGEQKTLSAELKALRETISLQMSGRYRDIDAVRDFQIRDQKNIELERRIGVVETRVDRLENRSSSPR